MPEIPRPAIPRRALTRGAKLAALPVSYAGRTAWGVGKRIGGRPAEVVSEEVARRTAEQVFSVLGELKGGAMKVGQAMSIFEAGLPEEIAGPYRATLAKLQDAAPPMRSTSVHALLAEELGPDWRSRFQEFSDQPAAAASIGQVHRAIWHDGRVVAVKLQYPGADRALMSDLDQMVRMSKVIAPLLPGFELKPLVEEVRARAAEELDYLLEAEHQRGFANAFEGDREFAIPHVLVAGPHVLVSEWVDGIPLSRVISDGSDEERDRVGTLYARFLLAGPARAGLLHADPHPGNYRLTPDGRLGIVDFGAVGRLPDGIPADLGRLLRLAQEHRADEVVIGLRELGFIKPGIAVEPEHVVEYFEPLVDPTRREVFHFTRDWLRGQFTRYADLTDPKASLAFKLNLPTEYVLIHRVLLGGIAVMCQLDAHVPMRDTLQTWLPGFDD